MSVNWSVDKSSPTRMERYSALMFIVVCPSSATCGAPAPSSMVYILVYTVYGWLLNWCIFIWSTDDGVDNAGGVEIS